MINLNPIDRQQSGESDASSASPSNHHCWVSFGGNVGDVKGTFDAALALLSLHPMIELGQRAGIYGTKPMGSQAGPPFLNSICGLSTRLSPRELLRVLQAVENQLGRTRDVRWGPRTLDLDLISHGDAVVNEPDLVIPHPALAYRRFVLDPLIEIAPEWRHPFYPESAAQLQNRLTRRPLKVELIAVPRDEVEKIATLLCVQFPGLEIVRESAAIDDVLAIRLTSVTTHQPRSVIDLRHSPGCFVERLTSAFTVIFDQPDRICDW